MNNATHLVLDVLDVKNHTLKCKLCLKSFLVDSVEMMGMSAMMDPHIISFDNVVPDQTGYSGFVVIAESHLSFHTYPENNLIYIDLFSCREFDVEKLITYVKMAFNSTNVRIQVIRRYSIK